MYGRRYLYSKNDKKYGIQITPLLDVLLVLLVVFMAVTPAVISGIDVSLPESSIDDVSKISRKSIVTISLMSNGAVYVENKLVDSESFSSDLNEYSKNNKDAHIFIKSDKNCTYGNVVSLINLISQMGYKNTILITDPK